MDSYISKHFCNDTKKEKEFFEYVICQNYMTFGNKRQLFVNILKNNNLEFHKKYSKVLNEIVKIIEMRNTVAHFMSDSSHKGVEYFKKTEEVSFMKIKNGTTSFVFSKYELKKFEERINNLRIMFDELGEYYHFNYTN